MFSGFVILVNAFRDLVLVQREKVLNARVKEEEVHSSDTLLNDHRDPVVGHAHHEGTEYLGIVFGDEGTEIFDVAKRLE